MATKPNSKNGNPFLTDHLMLHDTWVHHNGVQRYHANPKNIKCCTLLALRT